MSSTFTGLWLGLAVVVATGGLAACGGSDGSDGSSESGPTYVDGQTFTMRLAADPGALDPQGSSSGGMFQVSQLAYDPLVSVDPKTGEILPQLATSWAVDGTTVTFEIGSGITCSDGTAFDAQTVVDNISYVGDPKNQSPYLGVFLPAGATAKASGSTVTVTLAAPAPFVLEGFSDLPMVCASGMEDRESLKDHTSGTGPFVLETASPGKEYVYAVRDGYTWGPDGATTAAEGTPAEVVVSIVENGSTAANLLLSGDINSAQIGGPDIKRLQGAGLKSSDSYIVIGQQTYNHAEARPTSDPAVRMALTQGVDYAELGKVLTSGDGEAATQLVPSSGCTGNSVEGNVPAFDAAAAAATLDAAGWTVGSDGTREKDGTKLALSFLYDSQLGAGGAAASELAVQQWKEIGIDVTAKQLATNEMAGPLFATGDWDIAWEPIGVDTPDQIVPFLSGATPPDGTNFSAIDNADYTASVEKAMTQTGVAGCDDWLAGEAALFQAADLVAFANQKIPIFAQGAEFDATTGSIRPTSIKMLG
jgi:peptide/nickel transport system substrate-binding protein